jgi:hypothetical protein
MPDGAFVSPVLSLLLWVQEADYLAGMPGVRQKVQELLNEEFTTVRFISSSVHPIACTPLLKLFVVTRVDILLRWFVVGTMLGKDQSLTVLNRKSIGLV